MNEIQPNSKKQEKKSPAPKAIYNVLIGLACVYVFFLLYQSVYSNYLTSKKISTLKNELATSKLDQTRFESLNAYYKTWTFQELEARKKLGFKMPNEKLIQVKIEESVQPQKPVVDQGKSNQNIIQKPNFEKWLDYIIGRQT